MLAPNNKRGVTYQTDEKHLINMSEFFVGVVNNLTTIRVLAKKKTLAP